MVFDLLRLSTGTVCRSHVDADANGDKGKDRDTVEEIEVKVELEKRWRCGESGVGSGTC